jgi:hypothetical protein
LIFPFKIEAVLSHTHKKDSPIMRRGVQAPFWNILWGMWGMCGKMNVSETQKFSRATPIKI